MSGSYFKIQSSWQIICVHKMSTQSSRGLLPTRTGLCHSRMPLPKSNCINPKSLHFWNMYFFHKLIVQTEYYFVPQKNGVVCRPRISSSQWVCPQRHPGPANYRVFGCFLCQFSMCFYFSLSLKKNTGGNGIFAPGEGCGNVFLCELLQGLAWTTLNKELLWENNFSLEVLCFLFPVWTG